MQKAWSLPSLELAKGPSSPLAASQKLCTVQLDNRRIQCHAVDGRTGTVRNVSEGRLPFLQIHRGFEAEQARSATKQIAEPLPPLQEILRSAVQDLKLVIPKKGERMPREAAKPRQPHRRPRKAASPNALGPPSPKSPPPQPGGGVTVWRAPYAAEAKRRRPRAADVEPAEKKTSHVSLEGKDVATGAQQPAAGEPSSSQHDSPVVPGGGGSGATSPFDSETQVQDNPAFPGKRRQPLVRGSTLRFTKEVAEELANQETEKKDESFFWDDEEVRNVFVKFDFDKDGELHRDQLPGVLRYLWAQPEPGDVEQILEQQTPFATLSLQEFREFLTLYREIDRVRSQMIFNDADEDGSGFLEFEELHELLSKLGFSPCIETTLEAFRAVDKASDMKLNFNEFEALREHLRLTEGFRKAEVTQIRDLYDRVGLPNHRGHDRIVWDCWRLVTYFGYPVSRESIENVVKEVDADRSGVICFPEMLKIIRRVRDNERDTGVRVMEKLTLSDDGEERHLTIDSLFLAFDELDYYLSEEAAHEIMEDMMEVTSEDLADVSTAELFAFLRGYRTTDGFTVAEIKEFETVFNEGDRRVPGSLTTLEVGPVLRWFGFARTLQQVQRLVEELDFDESGMLEFPEFVKLMRRLTQLEAKKRREAFKHFDGGTGKIPATSLTAAVSILVGTEPSPALLREALRISTNSSGSEAARLLDQARGRRASIVDLEMANTMRDRGSLTRRGFEAFWREYNRLAVQEVRAKSGYNAAEVAKLKRVFESYDTDKSGTVERAELSKMIAEYFPDATKSKQGQQDIQKSLSEAHRKGNGELDFAEFLSLMRKCDDRRDAADMEHEQAAAAECGLTPEEVDGFRQIFSAHVDWRGELDLHTLASLLGRVVDLSDGEAEDLGRIVREVHPHSREVARFPQFLRLIKRLTQDNYGGVNNAAARFVKRQKMFPNLVT